MRVPDEIKQRFDKWDDHLAAEQYHEEYDEVVLERLRELDLEFVKDMEQMKEEWGHGFWYS